ncbi:PQQ-binding-like beta-propeller repeat protein [Streptomyces sp. PanSC19]|uniref:outer membrane protein assembly factor BamB family protein n=1 Tax=Streptomyces sp. PanSC19 TaxID=1520455 RepID=UPI000F4765DE|nr:PQQ-binding-like beta-propeller repeat protein [Streptomyces sp. PanSC19]
MQRPSQPWYAPRPPQQPVPGNPYAPEGYAPPGPPPRRGRFGRRPVLAVVLVVLLLLAGGGVYAAGGGWWGGPAAPVAKRTPRPSGAPTPSRTPAVRTPAPERVPTSDEINAGRAPGEATAWVVDDPTDLPRRSVEVRDLWTVGDTVVQALYKKVTAHRLSDGAELWTVHLPTPVCETPAAPTPDGKVVVVRQNREAWSGYRCDQLQMIDLRTGRTGWHRQLTRTGSGDDTIIVNTALSGDVLAVGQGMKAAAYRVGDGTKLYDIPLEEPGRCHPDDVAGGARLLVKADCAISVDRTRSYSQLRALDPRTGKVLWRFRTPPGWEVGRVLSVDPVVLTTFRGVRRDDWRVVALRPDGKLRTTIDPRAKGFTYCADAGESGEDIQECDGTLVGPDTVYLGGTDRVGAYDLGTGKFLWGVRSSLTRLHPLHAEAGSAALVYESATPSRPGGIIRLGPGGADTEKRVLNHPASAVATEYAMLAGRLAYVKGRIVITPSSVSGDDRLHRARMLSFAPAAP